MYERGVTVALAAGLHTRPAVRLVELARGFESDVWLARPRGTDEADAKDAIEVLALDVDGGEELVVGADGPDERRAVDELAAFLRGVGA